MSGVSLIDTRVLGKPSQFHGKEKEFLEWRENFASWAELHPAVGSLLDAAGKEKTPINYEKLPPDMRTMAHLLFHVLMQVCKNKAFTLVRRVNVETKCRNGFEAWRRLIRRFHV